VPGPSLLPDRLRRAPFTLVEARALDVPAHVLAGARFRSPFYGVHVHRDLPDSLAVRCAALALVVPEEAAFSHYTAAALCGLPLPEVRRPSLHVGVPVGITVPQLRGVTGHVGLDVGRVVVAANGLRVVHPCRTWCDLVPALRDDDAVILGDAVARRWGGASRLRAEVERRSGARGVVRMRRLVAWVRDRVDSPMETRSRLLVVRAGLPWPECGRDVHAGFGWIASPDLSWPEYKVAVEYDGDHHRTDKKQWRNDIKRNQGLEDEGWRVIVLTADDVLKYPEETVRRIRRALIERGWTPPSP
jgi:hypothetical protein